MIKDLVNPTNFNLLLSNIGDVLVKALDAPLGYAINGRPCMVIMARPLGNGLL